MGPGAARQDFQWHHGGLISSSIRGMAKNKRRPDKAREGVSRLIAGLSVGGRNE